MAKVIKFNISHPGEVGAGLWGYHDAVTVTVENDPGGEDGEFEQYMRECLAGWFDGAKVTPDTDVTGLESIRPMAEAWCIIDPAGNLEISSDWKTEEDAWIIRLGWPARGEVQNAKTTGWRCERVSVFPVLSHL